jgi:hypothetical protein
MLTFDLCSSEPRFPRNLTEYLFSRQAAAQLEQIEYQQLGEKLIFCYHVQSAGD